MSRNIKQVTHDLLPIIESIDDLWKEVQAAQHELFESLKPEHPEIKEAFLNSIKAISVLGVHTQTALDYLAEMDVEADSEGMEKSYY